MLVEQRQEGVAGGRVHPELQALQDQPLHARQVPCLRTRNPGQLEFALPDHTSVSGADCAGICMLWLAARMRDRHGVLFCAIPSWYCTRTVSACQAIHIGGSLTRKQLSAMLVNACTEGYLSCSSIHVPLSTCTLSPNKVQWCAVWTDKPRSAL